LEEEMKKYLKVAAIACLATVFAHGAANAALSCGGLSEKDADRADNLSSEISIHMAGALSLLGDEAIRAKETSFFSLDGSKAIVFTQYGSQMRTSAKTILELIPIRDKTTDPNTKKQLEEFIHYQAYELVTQAGWIVDDSQKLKKYATPHWWPDMEEAVKTSKQLMSLLKACK